MRHQAWSLWAHHSEYPPVFPPTQLASARVLSLASASATNRRYLSSWRFSERDFLLRLPNVYLVAIFVAAANGWWWWSVPLWKRTKNPRIWVWICNPHRANVGCSCAQNCNVSPEGVWLPLSPSISKLSCILPRCASLIHQYASGVEKFTHFELANKERDSLDLSVDLYPVQSGYSLHTLTCNM